MLHECIESVKRFVKSKYKLVVVDNASSDGSREYILKLQKEGVIAAILNKENIGFARANNQAMKTCQTKYCLLLNSDTKLTEDAITPVIKYMEDNASVNIASCRLNNRDGSLQPTGGNFPTVVRVLTWMLGLNAFPIVRNLIKPYHPKSDYYKGDMRLDWVTGAFFMIRTSLFKTIGYFDEDYFMYVEEMDFCYRASLAGSYVWYLSEPSIIHYGGGSSTSAFALSSELKNVELFFKKHKGLLVASLIRIIIKIGVLIRCILYLILGKYDRFKIYKKILITA